MSSAPTRSRTPGRSVGSSVADDRRFDVAVIGAGFGGLGTALSLAERGARVALFESLNYPGGCASTFERDGHRFESGATLFSGLAPGQLFGTWIERYGLDVQVEWIDPVIELRTPDWKLAVTRDRHKLVQAFQRFPDAPHDELERFFRMQRKVADLLWGVLEDPERLPPFGARGLLRNLRHAAHALPVARWVGRPLFDVLKSYGLADFAPLRTYLDALCQITVQCSAAEAEAPFALGAMDYVYRGTGHVRDGIGSLAWGLVDGLTSQGARVSLSDRVRSIERTGSAWRVSSRRGAIEADTVVANVLPHGLRKLLGVEPGALRKLDRTARDVERSWGACMLYLTARAPQNASPEAAHLELVHDPKKPLVEGNHIFCSIASAADRGRTPQDDPRLRTMTVSTHLPMKQLRTRASEEQGEYVQDVQQRMRRTLSALAPEWELGVTRSMPASPRTFERFTGRYAGYVGGAPRRVGEVRYTGLLPRPVLPGLFLVGDSVLTGQSTLATALGGVKVADTIARTLSPTSTRNGAQQ